MTVEVRGIPYDFVEVAMRLGVWRRRSCEESGTLFTGPNDVKTYYDILNHNYVYLGLLFRSRDLFLIKASTRNMYIFITTSKFMIYDQIWYVERVLTGLCGY